MLDLLSRALRPTVVVIEDIHWADEATLDLIKFLGRRINRTHGLLLLTYRDATIPGDQPLRTALADIPGAVLDRIDLAPLSRQAVSAMASASGRSVEGLWEASGGNPFYLTELLATEREAIPVSVQDAVLARVSRLSPAARGLIEFVSVVPSRAELDLVQQILGPSHLAIAEAEQSGVIEVKESSLSFRHELARRSIESNLPTIRKRELNLSVLRAIESLGYDVARAAHHARAGGDIASLLRLAPVAARRAAEVESHDEAVAHLRSLEPHLDLLDSDAAADHYDLWAHEESVVNEIERASDLIETAIAMRARLGDPRKLGHSLLSGSQIAWFHNQRELAVELANRAAEILEPIGGELLGSAYSAISRLAMLASDESRTLLYGERALAEVGEGPSQVRAHALNNIGSVRSAYRYPEGVAELEESYAIASELGLTHDQVRAAGNIGWLAIYFRDLKAAELWIGRALDLSVQRQAGYFEAYNTAARALIDEMLGHWAESEARARHVLDHFSELGTATMVSTTLLGRLQARRGEPEALSNLLKGWALAVQADEIQRTGPAAIALAEYAWIGGRLGESVYLRLQAVLGECIERESPWIGGELAYWLMLIGLVKEMPESAAEPYRLAAAGEWEKAAALWEQLGIPYDRAVALSQGTTEARLEGLALFDELGAVPLAARTRAVLTKAGITGIPRGPIRATRGNRFGLTSRQLDVLRHLAEDMTNAEIAERLFLSSRTVEHHVSAILGKLGAETRAKAVATARQAGVLDGQQAF
jgi:DNA-binding CsgD family transcriptional regulator